MYLKPFKIPRRIILSWVEGFYLKVGKAGVRTLETAGCIVQQPATIHFRCSETGMYFVL